jgi:hypothetical protein
VEGLLSNGFRDALDRRGVELITYAALGPRTQIR